MSSGRRRATKSLLSLGGAKCHRCRMCVCRVCVDSSVEQREPPRSGCGQARDVWPYCGGLREGLIRDKVHTTASRHRPCRKPAGSAACCVLPQCRPGPVTARHRPALPLAPSLALTLSLAVSSSAGQGCAPELAQRVGDEAHRVRCASGDGRVHGVGQDGLEVVQLEVLVHLRPAGREAVGGGREGRGARAGRRASSGVMARPCRGGTDGISGHGDLAIASGLSTCWELRALGQILRGTLVY